ncbi:hypothetical protein BH23BAC3_BH23BAC3_19220 [soil metagenome]
MTSLKNIYPIRPVFSFIFLLQLLACSVNDKDDTLFVMLPEEFTGVDFTNHLDFMQEFNIYTYPKFYDGGGVSIGDISGHGLPDIYLVRNMGPNKL